jgi:hypothetical protein
MSKRDEVTVLEKQIVLPGCRVTRTALMVDVFDEPTLIGAGLWLQTVEASRAWWWGDFLNAYCAWSMSIEDARFRAHANADPELLERQYTHYTGRYSEIAGVEPGTLREWRGVAAFFKVSSRLPTLSWAHHQEAMDGAHGDPAVAQDWLDKAQSNGWSKTELRAQIRATSRLSRESPEPMPSVRMQDLFAFNRWARTQVNRVADMDASEAATIRRELEPAKKLIDQLDARIDHPRQGISSRLAPAGG